MEPDIVCALLEKIRARPGMYLAEKDLTRLEFCCTAMQYGKWKSTPNTPKTTRSGRVSAATWRTTTTSSRPRAGAGSSNFIPPAGRTPSAPSSSGMTSTWPHTGRGKRPRPAFEHKTAVPVRGGGFPRRRPLKNLEKIYENPEYCFKNSLH